MDQVNSIPTARIQVEEDRVVGSTGQQGRVYRLTNNEKRGGKMQGRGRSDCETSGVAKEEKRRKGGRNLDRQRGVRVGKDT